MPARASEPDREIDPSGHAEPAFRALLRSYGLIDRLMSRYFARFGISASQWAVLRTLHRAEKSCNAASDNPPNANPLQAGLRLTDLSERLLIQPPSVTGVIDRLQRTGLVVRDHSPTDLRSKRVTLTTEGRALVERVLEVHQNQILQLMAGLNSQQQADLHSLLSVLGKHLETQVESGQTGKQRLTPAANGAGDGGPNKHDES